MPGAGDSKQTTQTSQAFSSQSTPYAPSQGLLTGILDQLKGQLGNTGVSQGQTDAISAYQGLAPQFNGVTQNLLNGGGALNQTGAINQNYQDYLKNTQPLASNTNYNPLDTPGFKDALSTTIADITNSTNGAFAAAGRDFSGANSQALGRGIMQGVAPTIAAQFNQNVSNQQGAARDLYGAGNTNAGLLSNLQQQYLQNQGQGISTAGDVLGGQIGAGSAGLGTTAQNLGLLANIGVPIADAFKSTSGTSNGTSNSTYTPSMLSQMQQMTQLAGAIPGAAASVFKFISDRNAKEYIAQVGTLFDGTPVYRFRYIGDPRFQIGLMAQDIEQRTPEAVGQIGPWKAVDYKKATDGALAAIA